MPYDYTKQEADALITTTGLLIQELAKIAGDGPYKEKLERLRKQHAKAFSDVTGITFED